MSTQEEKKRLELLHGTLDVLILQTSIFGAQRGQGIARAIQQTSDDELLVERGGISAKRGTSSNNRKARLYSLTAAGRKQLVKETTKWKRLTAAVGRILASEANGS